MFGTSAIFSRKESQFETEPCVINKVIRLSGGEYDGFSQNMLADRDFIRDNQDLMGYEDGVRHCLLVVSDERRDGILVHSSGYDYARYAAFVPSAEGMLTVGRYPALSDLAKRLTDIADSIVEQAVAGERTLIDLQDLETEFGIDLMANGVIRQTVLGMLNERSEVVDWELDNNELLLYGAAEKLSAMHSDPTVAKNDSLTNEKLSVLNQLREARLNPHPSKDANTPDVKKDKGGPEL